MALNPPSGIVKWYNTPLGERGWNSFRAQLTGKDYPGASRKTSYVKLSDEEADEVISNIKKDSEGIPLFDEANAPDKAEEYQKWLVARYLTKSREEGFEERKTEGLEELEDELGPEGLDELLNLIKEETKAEVGAAVGGGGGSSSAGSPPPPPPEQSSSALAVVPKKPDDLVEEDIDSQILSILGLEDVFDLTYEEYASLLKEVAVKGRMPGSQMTTESIELVTEEYKRVKGKTGRFKVKPKKVDINKVLDRREPSSAIVKAQKLIPQPQEFAKDGEVPKTEARTDVQEDLLNGIGNILESLISIRKVLQDQEKLDKKKAETDRKEKEKQKKKKRESILEGAGRTVKALFKKVTKPFTSFFDAIKKFFLNILLGSALNFLLAVVRNPGILLNPIRGFVNSIVNFLNGIIDFVWNMVISPINLVINGINTGIQSAINAINSVTGVLGIPPISSDPIPTLPSQSPVRIPNWNAPVQQQAEGGEVTNILPVPVPVQRQAGGGGVVNIGDISLMSGGGIKENTGLKVSGFGKDTQLVAAQPGEIMMSKSAVNYWGKDTLLGMNAMGGGTNKPKIGRMGITAMSGGGVVQTQGVWATGPGYTIQGQTDEQGRPVVFSKEAASAFMKMITDSGGTVSGRDVASSKRSPEKNSAVGGASRSKHMYGIAMDIHGRSNTWIRQHGHKYGWVANDYPGSHGGHFEFQGKGAGLSPSGTSGSAPGEELKLDSYSPSRSSSTAQSLLPTIEGNLSEIFYGPGAYAPTSGGIDSPPHQASSSGNQHEVHRFSSIDLNNPSQIVVKSLYNLVD